MAPLSWPCLGPVLVPPFCPILIHALTTLSRVCPWTVASRPDGVPMDYSARPEYMIRCKRPLLNEILFGHDAVQRRHSLISCHSRLASGGILKSNIIESRYLHLLREVYHVAGSRNLLFGLSLSTERSSRTETTCTRLPSADLSSVTHAFLSSL